MSSPAHVTSLEALRGFRSALKRYETEVRQILENLGIEVQRAVDWIDNDRTPYWPAQAKRADEMLAAARTELELCKLAALKEENRSCLQEKKNLERAVARLRLCEEKAKVVRLWRHRIDHESTEFRGKVARLIHYLDRDIPRALAALDRMIDALQKYTEPSGRPTLDPTHFQEQ